jgi:hypothetical protein
VGGLLLEVSNFSEQFSCCIVVVVDMTRMSLTHHVRFPAFGKWRR